MNELLEWTGERLITTIKAMGVVEHLHRYAIACEFVNDKVVLDLASGEGYGSYLLAKKAKKVIGIDISREVVSFANVKYRQDNLIFRTGTVTKIPIENESIDIVVSFETIEHIMDQDIMLSEIKRVLKPNGLLVISSPEKSNYGDVNKEINHFHVKELYLHEFERLILKCFKNYYFIFQKQIHGTIAVPQGNSTHEYTEYTGDFTKLDSTNRIKNPVFNICLASNHEIPKVDLSFFDGHEYYENKILELQNHIHNINNSRIYRIGKSVLYPWIKLKKWFVK